MGNWSKLNANLKALVIQFAILNGVSNIQDIRDTYNLYSNGGNLVHKYDGNTENSQFINVDASLPKWGQRPNGPHWGLEGVSGINGKRYLHYPKQNFYVNEDGTVRAYGYESLPIVNRYGTNYIEIPAIGENSTATWYTDYSRGTTHTVQNFYRIPVGNTTPYIEPRPQPVKKEPAVTPIISEYNEPVVVPLNIPLEIINQIINLMPPPSTPITIPQTHSETTSSQQHVENYNDENNIYIPSQKDKSLELQMWKYPVGNVTSINFADAESAKLFNEELLKYMAKNLSNLSGNTRHNHIFSNRPLTGALNDSTFIKYLYSPKTLKFEMVEYMNKPVTASILKGEHTKTGVENVIIRPDTWDHSKNSDERFYRVYGNRDDFYDMTIDPNLQYDYVNDIPIFDKTGLPLLTKYYSYYDNAHEGPLRNIVVYKKDEEEGGKLPVVQLNILQEESANILENTNALTEVFNNTTAFIGNTANKVKSFFGFDFGGPLAHKKSTGGPLYPFSFEKNPFLKTPVVRYDEGGNKLDASNPGGYTDLQLNKNYLIWKTYDPTGGLNFINYVLSLNFGNMARGEENEYWKEYLGLPSAVPLMNSNANTEWDKKIEQEKIAKGELASDFYGTTPRMDYNILALADTLMLGEMVRNYEKYDLEYNLPSIESITEAYELAKTILNNPNKWTQVDGEIEVNNWPFNPNISESNPLGMLANFGMKWVPEENALYMHDTYDFPSRVHKKTEIPVRPREMKIRSKISFDPTKGSWLLRSPVNYNTEIPAKVTK